MSAGQSVKADYIDALIEEIRGYREKYECSDTHCRVETVYIGGGTPSCMDVPFIDRIMKCLDDEFEYADRNCTEITIEVNPGTVTYDMLKAYRQMGISRLSIGLQSANDNELKALGRIHDFKDFVRTYNDARKAGFSNINVDLMTAIPGQTIGSLVRTLNAVRDAAPEHVSAYSLIIEEGTLFYDLYGREDLRPFDDETEREMYHMTVSFLESCGYERYEISNFAKKGYESRHNTSYWKRKDYLGFGLGASSFTGNIRYRNTPQMQCYVNQPASPDIFDERIPLSADDCMEEFMFLGLRMSRGVSDDDFRHEFGRSIRDRYAREIDRFISEGLIIEEKGNIRLTEKGIDYGNYVFAGFLK